MACVVCFQKVTGKNGRQQAEVTLFASADKRIIQDGYQMVICHFLFVLID
jgi:hypothetical protein